MPQLFKSDTAQGVWIQHWCVRCYRNPDECVILTKALKTQRRPPQWERNNRPQTMADAYRCDSFSRKQPKPTKHQQFVDVPMFDVPEEEVGFVPVDGWPERPKRNEVDHA